MGYQFLGTHQRPKGANIKQALQLMLLLAVFAWLVYQIDHSREKTEKYGGQSKLVEEYGVVSLGRKGTTLWLNERALPNSGNVHFVEAEKITDGREKAEQEFRSNDGQEMKEEAEKQSKVSPKNKYKDGNYPKRPVILDDSVSLSNEKEAEVQVREALNNVQMRKKDKLDGSIDGIHSFHDENGVLPDGNETEPISDDKISGFSKETRLSRESNIYQVTFGEDNDIAEMTLKDSADACK